MRACVFVLATVFMMVPAISFASSEEPMHVIVSLKEQSLRLFQGGEEIARSNVSTGKRGHSTPTGIFSILEKRRYHRSNIYSNAPMPFMQRLTWSGIALHASNSVPRHPASHGCVRLPHSFAKKLFSMTSRGAHVIIEHDARVPEKFEHRSLFQPRRSFVAEKISDRWVREIVLSSERYHEWQEDEKPLRILITRRSRKQDIVDAQRILNALGYNAGDVDGIMGPATHRAIKRFQEARGYQVKGLVDRELLVELYRSASEPVPRNGHLFVRQNFKPLFDVAIDIKNPDRHLGSHLLTVMNFDKGQRRVDWMALSLEDKPDADLLTDGEKFEDAIAQRQQLEAVFGRIEMDLKTRKRIAEALTPGSSISISDNGISLETTPKGTDFIVLTQL